jgi:hypothetical protein
MWGNAFLGDATIHSRQIPELQPCDFIWTTSANIIDLIDLTTLPSTSAFSGSASWVDGCMKVLAITISFEAGEHLTTSAHTTKIKINLNHINKCARLNANLIARPSRHYCD